MLVDRIMGVLRLNAATFEEIEADQTATGQAAVVVALVALLGAIGTGLAAENFVTAFVVQLVWAFVAWFLWAILTLWIGTSIFDGKADLGEMLRVTGFAQAPRVLSVLSFIPCVGWLIALAAGIWALVAAFIGIRQGLDLDNVKTLVTVIIGWLVVFIGSLIIGFVFAGAAAGLGALTG